jgi:hypothetical protein
LPWDKKIADLKVRYTKDSRFLGYSEFHSSVRQLAADRSNPPASGNPDMAAIQSSIVLNQKQVRRPLCGNLLEGFPCQFGIHANYAAREKFREGDCVLIADLRVEEAVSIKL